MKLKTIDYENFNHYKKPSMVLGFPHCTFKCDKECGKQVCQNSALASAADIEISKEEIFDRYINNHITSAIVCAGFEPFDDFADLYEFITYVRKEKKCNDDIVIYSGYTEEELHQKNRCNLVLTLENNMEMTIPNCDMFQHIYLDFRNIIVKFGRFIPDQESHYDEVLGVNLASNNQYAKKLS